MQPNRDINRRGTMGGANDPSLIRNLSRTCAIAGILVAVTVSLTAAAPIQRIEGVISKVGEGYLLLKPVSGSVERRFILRWKARFTPPKLPLEGDRVLLLYKDKENGSIIYGVDYLGTAADFTYSGSDRGKSK
jgi:hypothetical protein